MLQSPTKQTTRQLRGPEFHLKIIHCIYFPRMQKGCMVLGCNPHTSKTSKKCHCGDEHGFASGMGGRYLPNHPSDDGNRRGLPHAGAPRPAIPGLKALFSGGLGVLEGPLGIPICLIS